MTPIYSGYPKSQHPSELEPLKALAAQCHSYLEIGCRHGDTLLEVGLCLPVGSRIVGIDLPGGPWGREDTLPHFKRAVAQLKQAGYQAKALVGDSKSKLVVAAVRKLAPFDLIFIDGDHSLAGVTADWQLYHPLGRMIAFHDIAHQETKNVAVWKLWRDLKKTHQTQEFVDPQCRDMGIGVIFQANFLPT